MESIRTLVADDHVLFRKGLVNLLSSQHDLEVVGECDNGLEAFELAKSLMPDVILMDIAMPVCSGLEATQLIKAEVPYAKVIILTVSDSEREFLQAIKAGASGYLLKDVEPEHLYQYIRDARSGNAPISPTMASKMLTAFSRRLVAQTALEDALSPREREVLDLLAMGTTNREIGAALSIAENTVKNHLKNILGKLHLRNRVEITAYAFKHGLSTKATPRVER